MFREVSIAVRDRLERFDRWSEKVRREQDERLFLALTLVIGALVGLVIVAFILITEHLGARMYPQGAPPWRRLVIPIAGSLITGYLLQRFFPNARGSGIPQTKVALFVQNGRIELRTVLGKFGCASGALASGLALGREGPSVQVGAGIASVIGKRLGYGPDRLRALIPVGCSAALAAAFNTPVAAVIFTMEEILGDLHASVLGSIVISSATSWMVLHLVLGDEPLFHVPPYQLVHPVEFAIYALLGLIGGICSVAFVKLLLFIRAHFLRFPKWTGYFQPAFGGVVVGILGWFVPSVMGVGYDYVSQVLNNEFPFKMMALLILLKIVATATCYGSGNAGGIFGPSLFIGAMIGGTVGSVAHHFLPHVTGTAGAYALVGMGTAFAGIVRTPLTSVFMIFEVTRDYTIIVPLMISNLISFYMSYQLQPEPVYEALAHQDGIHLPSSERRERLGRLRVLNAMSEPQTVSPDTIVSEIAATAHRDVLVAEDGTLWGVLRRAEVQNAQPVKKVRELIHTAPDQTVDMDAEHFPHVHMDHPLDLALERMGTYGLDVLPVVDRANARQLRGAITLDNIMQAYHLKASE